MKAWAITSEGRMALIEKEKTTPAADEVLVNIHVVGYCGSDLNTFRGLNPLAQLPRVPGHELEQTAAAFAKVGDRGGVRHPHEAG